MEANEMAECIKDGSYINNLVWLANYKHELGTPIFPTFLVGKWPDYELIPILHGDPQKIISEEKHIISRSKFQKFLGYTGIWIERKHLEKLDKHKSLFMLWVYEIEDFNQNREKYIDEWRKGDV